MLYPKGFRQFSPQKGLLMRMLGVGQRKVWLDPTKKDIISKVKTRKEMWDLLHQGVVRRKFSPRGTHQTPGGPFLFLKPQQEVTSSKTYTPLQLAIQKAKAKDAEYTKRETEIKKALEAKEAKVKEARDAKIREIARKARIAKKADPTKVAAAKE